jgi:hypothetical protein
VILSDKKIDVTSYTRTDDFFGPAYVDADEVRDEPVRHRRIHGGFADTDTRFLLHLPEESYQGRMYRDGEAQATSRRVHNVASARVVVE